MSVLYKSERIGKGGKPFLLLKIRTLHEGVDAASSFASAGQYLFLGRFLRATHADEFPQVWNILRGQMCFFGWRPEEKRTWDILPAHVREKLALSKPGLIDLASVTFFDEERLLQQSHDPHQTYWEHIRPIKFVLQCFHLDNRCWLLNLSVLWLYMKKLLARR